MSCVKPITINQNGKFYTVPCYHCLLCRISRVMSWLFRIEQEIKYSTLSGHYFVTLTYSEKKVPRKKGVRTLYKRHPQLWFKRLRKQGWKVKYILVGEYGSSTDRPHYHVILFTNARPDELARKWTYGHIHVGKLEKSSVLYTLGYVLNEKTGDNEQKQREYAVFSKGLGAGYLTEAMHDWHSADKWNPRFFSIKDGKEVPLPRYYWNKCFTKFQRAINQVNKRDEFQEQWIERVMYLQKMRCKNIPARMKAAPAEKAAKILRSRNSKNKSKVL